VVEDDLELLKAQRPIFFIEKSGAEARQNAKSQMALLDNAQVANSQQYWLSDQADPRKTLQDQIARKLTQHLEFAEHFYKEHYPDVAQGYAYRQPVANPTVLEHLIRQQLRSPLSFLEKCLNGCYSVENFSVLWPLIDILTRKNSVKVVGCLLSHREDQPRSIILKEDPLYHTYMSHINRFLHNIPAQQHRVFIFVEYPDLLKSASTVHAMLVLDIREGYQVCGLTQVQLVDLDRIPFHSLQEQLDMQEKMVKTKNLTEFLVTSPEGLYIEWMRNSSRLFRPRHNCTKRIDKAVLIYSQLMQHLEVSQMTLPAKLHELWRLHQLVIMTDNWLYQWQHISSRSDSMWSLRLWLKQRFAQRAQDYLHCTYQDTLFLNSSNLITLTQSVYADMVTCLLW
jgi:hypothetical protein